MAVKIHPTAIVDPKAQLGENVEVGPYAIIEANTIIGDGTVIGCHALIAWGTRIGRKCRIFNGASVGTIPQDLKFAGEETTLEIGDECMIREFCTLNRGTMAAGKTVVGNNCALLAYCHVAHDCIVGDHVVASNNLALAGHVIVESNVTFGGYVTVHQFCHIGKNVFVQAGSRVFRDVVPFAMCGGEPGDPKIVGINKVGLERNGYDEERRATIKRAYRTLFRQGLNVEQALPVMLEQYPANDDILSIVNFIKGSERGIIRMDVD